MEERHSKAIAYILQEMKNGLPDTLRYHSVEHTESVLTNARAMAQVLGVEGKSLELLLTAAAFHDCGFLKTYRNHELVGCEIAAEKLPEYGFDRDEIKAIQGMIMATKIPQSPSNLLENILCDADLYYLGGNNYERISQNLFDELELNGTKLSENEWLTMQVNFLKTHHYWTEHAQQLLDPQKQIVLIELKDRAA